MRQLAVVVLAFLPFASLAAAEEMRSIRVSNQMKQQFEARRQAVEIAREKALHLTELTGMTLGSPIRIEEDIEHNWDTGGAGMMARKPSVNEQDDRPRLPEPKIRFVSQRNEAEAPTEAAGAGWQHDALVAPGQIRIQARVTVEFQMAPTPPVREPTEE